jgi:hypothetical protein
MGRAEHRAFVSCLGDGQVLILSSSSHQHAALGTMGFSDCTVPGRDLVHKRDTLNCGHICLHIEKAPHSFQELGDQGSLAKNIPDGKRLGCSLLHTSCLHPSCCTVHGPAPEMRRIRPGIGLGASNGLTSTRAATMVIIVQIGFHAPPFHAAICPSSMDAIVVEIAWPRHYHGGRR